jgi:hypothetical protein
MPMGTDPVATPPTDPRDAEIANLKSQIEQLMKMVPAAAVQVAENPTVSGVETAAEPIAAQAVSDAKTDLEPVEKYVENEFTHWLHLADGRVMKLVGTVTHWFDSDDPNAVGVPVIGVYAK